MSDETLPNGQYQEGAKIVDCGEEGVIKRSETHPNGRTTYYVEFGELQKVDEKELERGIVDGTIQVLEHE